MKYSILFLILMISCWNSVDTEPVDPTPITDSVEVVSDTLMFNVSK